MADGERCPIFMMGKNCDVTYAAHFGVVFTVTHILYGLMIVLGLCFTVPRAIQMFKRRGFNIGKSAVVRLHALLLVGMLMLTIRIIDPFGWSLRLPYTVTLLTYDLNGAITLSIGLDVVFDWLRVVQVADGNFSMSTRFRRICFSAQIIAAVTITGISILQSTKDPFWLWHTIKIGVYVVITFALEIMFLIYGCRVRQIIIDSEALVRTPSSSSSSPYLYNETNQTTLLHDHNHQYNTRNRSSSASYATGSNGGGSSNPITMGSSAYNGQSNGHDLPNSTSNIYIPSSLPSGYTTNSSNYNASRTSGDSTRPSSYVDVGRQSLSYQDYKSSSLPNQHRELHRDDDSTDGHIFKSPFRRAAQKNHQRRSHNNHSNNNNNNQYRDQEHGYNSKHIHSLEPSPSGGIPFAEYTPGIIGSQQSSSYNNGNAVGVSGNINSQHVEQTKSASAKVPRLIILIIVSYIVTVLLWLTSVIPEIRGKCTLEHSCNQPTGYHSIAQAATYDIVHLSAYVALCIFFGSSLRDRTSKQTSSSSSSSQPNYHSQFITPDAHGQQIDPLTFETSSTSASVIIPVKKPKQMIVVDPSQPHLVSSLLQPDVRLTQTNTHQQFQAESNTNKKTAMLFPRSSLNAYNKATQILQQQQQQHQQQQQQQQQQQMKQQHDLHLNHQNPTNHQSKAMPIANNPSALPPVIQSPNLINSPIDDPQSRNAIHDLFREVEQDAQLKSLQTHGVSMDGTAEESLLSQQKQQQQHQPQQQQPQQRLFQKPSASPFLGPTSLKEGMMIDGQYPPPVIDGTHSTNHGNNVFPHPTLSHNNSSTTPTTTAIASGNIQQKNQQFGTIIPMSRSGSTTSSRTPRPSIAGGSNTQYQLSHQHSSNIPSQSNSTNESPMHSTTSHHTIHGGGLHRPSSYRSTTSSALTHSSRGAIPQQPPGTTQTGQDGGWVSSSNFFP